jgi:hypothetical protein
MWLLGNQVASHNLTVFEQIYLVGEIRLLWYEEEISHVVMV